MTVLPGLYVGNYRDSKDAAQLDRFEITHIVAIHDAARRLHPIQGIQMFYSNEEKFSVVLRIKSCLEMEKFGKMQKRKGSLQENAKKSAEL
ncbi:hypothetical protein J437_LFUL003180 [Ladona fulva]|uniref:Uncharacterized protein n=1 Tax=Ladona fulva TaxID=123851 RepID=A0A8K0JYT7_LADFU|nr:hypothetical protein J437_LFUL003180 [Ladona fulva]